MTEDTKDPRALIEEYDRRPVLTTAETQRVMARRLRDALDRALEERDEARDHVRHLKVNEVDSQSRHDEWRSRAEAAEAQVEALKKELEKERALPSDWDWSAK